MGILRTILAIAVVVFHSYKLFGLRMCGGQVAVQSFYMISGFYMALILNEKYTGPGFYKTFIASRFYRIFPVYWVVLLVVLSVSVIGYYGFGNPYYLGRYIGSKECLSVTALLYFIAENIIIIGQDVFYFLKLDRFCDLSFTYHVLSYKHTAFQYLLVPQAWSISIEFMFYLSAPFIVTKKIKWQILIILMSFTWRYIYIHYFYLTFDPWTYRFFPFELAFFLLGSLAYRYYKSIEKKNVSSKIGYGFLIGLVILIMSFDEITMNLPLKNYVFYAIFVCALPYLFYTFKNNKTDRYIGELSFSIYIIHHLIVSLFRSCFFTNPQYMDYYGYTVVIISIVLALLMQKILIDPLDRYRQKRFS